MDPFDDVFPEAPIAHARVGGKFIPKAKSKQLPRKEISTSELATSCNDGKNEHITSSSTSSKTVGNIPNKCINSVDSTQDTSVKEFLKSSHSSPVKIPISDNTTNPEQGNSQQINVTEVIAVLEDALHPTIAASEVNSNWNSTNFPKSANEADHVGDGPFHDGNKSLEPIDTSLQVGSDMGSKSASDLKVEVLDNIHSDSNLERAGEVESAEFELDPFSDTLPDPGVKNARKFQPKIKRRPRVGTAEVVASASLNEVLRTTDTSTDIDYTHSSMSFSEDKRSMETAIPSQSDSLNAMPPDVAVHNGARDCSSNLGKSSGETADIFSGLESLDDFVPQVATSTGKQTHHSFHDKGTGENVDIPACSTVDSSIFGVSDAGQVKKCPEYNITQDSVTMEAAVFNEGDAHNNNGRSESEEVVGLDPSSPVDDTLDFSSLRSGSDPTFEIPVHEELTNVAEGPTFGDFLNVEDVSGAKDASEKEKDATKLSSTKNHKVSSVAGETEKVGKPSRQLRKRATCKPVDPVEDEYVEEEDDLDPAYTSNIDELEEHDDECGLDNASKKKRASSSKKKSMARKPSQKRKRANEDSDKPAKGPPKKFSHSTRRRKRCVDKALLETPEDELDPQTLPIRDIILLADYRERLAKKEAATSETSSVNERDGGSLHEAAAHNEEILGSKDGRGPDGDQANEGIKLASSFFNYQSFMDKTPRGKWTKQDTELFYEAVQQFGTDFSMIQQLFPGRTRHQIKLKYKKEERQHPLELSDAVNNRGKDLSHFKSLIERLQQASGKAEQDPFGDASAGMTGEEMEDLTLDTDEEVPKPEQEAAVEDQEDNGSFHSPQKSDESDDDDFQRWCQYKSDY